MAQQFDALPTQRLAADSGYRRPPLKPFHVRLNSPALDILTDFEQVEPVTVSPKLQIDEALDKMRLAHVRLLLVVDSEKRVIGLITATDIHGERPINMIQSMQIPRSDISVDQIMTPRAEIDVFSLQALRSAQVGQVLATLEQLDRQHMLVVDQAPEDGAQRVRGVISASQIHRQLAGRTSASRVRQGSASGADAA